MSDVPASAEQIIERMRREAGTLSDYQLDVRIRETLARREVATAYGYHHTAAIYNALLIALADVRQLRTEATREIEDMTGPKILMRALTAEELAEGDEFTEPPC